MKRIGILTLVFQNFGTRLQTYALCKTIEKFCPKELSFEVIDVQGIWGTPKATIKSVLKKIPHYGLHFPFFLIDRFRWCHQKKKLNASNHDNEWNDRENKFHSLVSMIPMSSKKHTFEDIRHGSLNSYSEILVGSDQVWNGIKVNAQDIYMLDYFHKKGYTYAASFGITSIPPNMFADYRRRINHFHSLYIREEEGVKLCRSLGRADAKYVLDPTLLLEEQDYEHLVSQNTLVNGDYILVYSLNQSYKIYKQASRIAKHHNCKMIVLKRDFCPPNIKKYPNAQELFAISPEEFLWLVKNAKCIITNSYHAFLFSLIFKKNFYLYLDFFDEENSRMLSLIRQCHLNDRFFWETQSLPNEFGHIDYKSASNQIAKLRTQSLFLLQTALNQMI